MNSLYILRFFSLLISKKSRTIAACFGLSSLLLTGCTTTATNGQSEPATQSHVASAQQNQNVDELTLKEGDVIKVSFPGVPSMDTTLPVRADGRVALPLIGDYTVAGKTTEALSKELLEAYDSQLVSKEVNVTLVSSTYTIYVTGAVLRPGKIVVERRLTAFDAIMEAGGFDRTRANPKSVIVIRQENGQMRRYEVNLDTVFSGGQSAPFYLKPFDTIEVPEKFKWF